MGSESGPAGDSTKRSYRSPRRHAAAQATRRRIRDAASAHFLRDGYAATSVRDIAATAAVAEKTVYLHFPTKSALLMEAVQIAIVGDDDDESAARARFVEAIAQTNVSAKLRLLAATTSAMHERSGAILTVARNAAAVDPEVAGLWAFGKRAHLADTSALAQSLDQVGGLPPGLDVEWATTTLYILLGPETWQLARTELELDQTGYHDWLLSQLNQAFQPS